jgi:hypothetical protein
VKRESGIVNKQPRQELFVTLIKFFLQGVSPERAKYTSDGQRPSNQVGSGKWEVNTNSPILRET